MPYDTVWAVALADGENGKVVFVGRESGILEKFSAKHLSPEPPLLTLKPHEACITSIAASSADEVLTCSLDCLVKQYNTASEPPEGGKREMKKMRAGGPLRCMLVSGESTYCGSHDGNIYLLGAGEKPTVLEGHQDWVVALASTEGTLFSASYDGTVRAWDMASGRNTLILLGHTNQVKCVQFVNGTIFTASRDDTLRLWSMPADAGGGDASPAAQEGEDGRPTEGSKKGDSTAPTVVRSHAVVALPASPHTFALSGNTIFMGCDDCRVRSIATKDLVRTVTDFSDVNSSNFRKCKATVDSHISAAIKSKNAEAKRDIKKKKAAVQEEAAKRTREAAENARKQQAQPADGEEGMEPDPEPMREDAEEVQEIVLPDDLQAELAAFTEQRKKEAVDEVEKLREEQKQKIAALDPIKKQSFYCEVAKFDRVTFTRTFSHCEDSIVALQMDGTSAFIAVGDNIACTLCRPGVAAL